MLIGHAVALKVAKNECPAVFVKKRKTFLMKVYICAHFLRVASSVGPKRPNATNRLWQ